jgi:hypothetical protein
MRITQRQLRQLIREELNEARLPAWERAGYVPEVLYAAEAGLKAVNSIADAWSSLKRGESFSFEVPDGVADALKSFLGGDSWTPGDEVVLNECRRMLTENPAPIIAGIGAGLLVIVLVAMAKGYSTDVEVGGSIAGQSAKAKIVLKSPGDEGQVNIGTQQGDVKLDLRDTPGSEASDAGVSDEDLEVAAE